MYLNLEHIQEPEFRRNKKQKKNVDELKIQKARKTESFSVSKIGKITIKNRDCTDKSKIKTVRNGKVL